MNFKNKAIRALYIKHSDILNIHAQQIKQDALVNGSGGEYSESKRVDWQRENEASRQVREGCTCVDVESYCVCYGISESNTTGRVTIKSTYFNFYVKYLIVLQLKGPYLFHMHIDRTISVSAMMYILSYKTNNADQNLIILI